MSIESEIEILQDLILSYNVFLIRTKYADEKRMYKKLIKQATDKVILLQAEMKEIEKDFTTDKSDKSI